MNVQRLLESALANPNYAGVYEALWRQGQLTRGQLTSITGLAIPTIARIVSNLSKSGLLFETPSQGPNTSGRPASTIAIRPRVGYIIGIDLGGLDAIGALLTLNNEILASRPVAITKGDSAGIESSLISTVQHLLDESGVAKDEVLGVGIGVPSNLDITRSIVLDASNLEIKNWPIVSNISKELQLPVFIENDANTSALAHYYFDCPSDGDMAYISLDTGIGMGLVVNRQLFVGNLGNAGEIGHVVAAPDGPRCTCGKKGCLEALASSWAIARAYNAEKTAGSSNLDSVTTVSSDEVFYLAAQGDEIAKEVVARAARLIGLSIVGVVNIFSMSQFVLGGSMAEKHPGFVTLIRESVLENLPAEYLGQISITGTKLKNIGILGAGSLVMQKYLTGTDNRNRPSGSIKLFN